MSSIWISVVLFCIGVVLVVKGGDLFVDGASWIAKAFGIPPFIVGATIVSLATTLPELIVSVMAAADGKPDMAIGNAVGSVIANTGLILAVAMIFMQIISSRKQYLCQCILLLSAAAILWLGCLGGALSRWGTIGLMIVFVIYLINNVQTARSSMENAPKPQLTRPLLARNIVCFVLGAAGIVAGSQLLVNSGSDIATFLGIPERIVAITLVAIGTSLPELVTTITAITKKEAGLSIGNLIGANIIDLTLILPLSSLASGAALPISAQSIAVDLPVCFAIIAVALLPLIFREKGSRRQGILIGVCYAAYLVYIL